MSQIGKVVCIHVALAMLSALFLGFLLFEVLFSLGIEFAYNKWSILYAGVLVGVYFISRGRRPREEEHSGLAQVQHLRV